MADATTTLSNSTALYPSAVVLIVLSAIVVSLNITPLVWHFQHRNVAACSLIFWIMILNVMDFINALIWPRDNLNEWWDGEVLCDIQVRLIVGSWIALPGALACIMRGLANVMDTKRTVLVPSRSQRIRGYVLDLLLCFCLPIYMMLVYYIVQPFRYYIFGVSGCLPAFDNSWVSVSLIFVWPPIISLVDTYYGGLVIFRLYCYRRDFSRIVSTSNTTKSRFLRLFCISAVLVVGTLSTQLWVLASNINVPHHPYSWSNVHGDYWNSVVKVPSNGIVVYDRWIRVACGFLVFVFFGMGADAFALYRSFANKLRLDKVLHPLSPTKLNTFSKWEHSWGSRALSMIKRKSSGNMTVSTNSQRSSTLIASPTSTTHSKKIPLTFLFRSSKHRDSVLPFSHNRQDHQRTSEDSCKEETVCNKMELPFPTPVTPFNQLYFDPNEVPLSATLKPGEYKHEMPDGSRIAMH